MTSEHSKTIYIFPAKESLRAPWKLLKGLGKPTKRGIKKCYKCGVYNGTRGIICKNKLCDAVFKDSGLKPNSSLDAVRLITSNFRQVFSVRVRDVGPDYRGFVQLPMLHSHGENDSNIFSEVALCFVDSCQRLFDDSILHCHENELKNSSPLCIHIKSALQSKHLAVGLDIKKDILNTIRASDEIKEKLWVLTNTREEPFVQRISKNVMAVKCQVTPKHPLGYLHFSFLSPKGKEICNSYICSCTESAASHEKSVGIKSKCLHYFACICALASHGKFSEEFQQFITLELSSKSIFYDLQLVFQCNSSQSGVRSDFSVEQSKCRLSKPRAIPNRNSSRRSKCKLKKIVPKIFPLEIKVLDCEGENKISNNTPGEPVWTFTNWLSYLTESVNNTMLLENCETVTTLVFDVPKVFFETLFDKIVNVCYEKKNDRFIEETFQIDSIDHLKKIFDTSKVKLVTSKYFMQDGLSCLEFNSDCSRSKYMIQFDLGSNAHRPENIFSIDWLPNTLNMTDVGQLKLQYKLIVVTC